MFCVLCIPEYGEYHPEEATYLYLTLKKRPIVSSAKKRSLFDAGPPASARARARTRRLSGGHDAPGSHCAAAHWQGAHEVLLPRPRHLHHPPGSRRPRQARLGVEGVCFVCRVFVCVECVRVEWVVCAKSLRVRLSACAPRPAPPPAHLCTMPAAESVDELSRSRPPHPPPTLVDVNTTDRFSPAPRPTAWLPPHRHRAPPSE